MTTNTIKFNSADLALLPDDNKNYEIIDGELFVTRAPHWNHQSACGRLNTSLDNWSQATGLGKIAQNVGLVFGDENDVIPDLVWVSHERLANILDDAGHLTQAPELVVEVLSKSTEKQDKVLKLKLYSQQGVIEYWVVDWHLQQVMIYRREKTRLQLVSTLWSPDTLSSPVLPGFTMSVAQIFV